MQNQAFLKDSLGLLCAKQAFLKGSTWTLCAKQALKIPCGHLVQNSLFLKMCKNPACKTSCHFVQNRLNRLLFKIPPGHLVQNKLFLKILLGISCKQVFLQDSTWPLCAKQTFLKDSTWDCVQTGLSSRFHFATLCKTGLS